MQMTDERYGMAKEAVRSLERRIEVINQEHHALMFELVSLQCVIEELRRNIASYERHGPQGEVGSMRGVVDIPSSGPTLP